jgi:hypothetical protein
MAETGPGNFISTVIDEQPLFIPAGAVCECGHPVEAHHENQVTGDSTWCSACDIGGCDRFRPAAPPSASERDCGDE